MKKLNEVFDLPEDDNENDNNEKNFSKEASELEIKKDEYGLYDYESLSPVISKADEISKEIKKTDKSDADFDELSNRSIEVFEMLVDIGQNIEDKHVADVFDVASKMMTNSISAKTHKMERKIKALNLEIQNQKVDVENRKLEQRIKERRQRGDDTKPIEGNSEQIEMSRDELIQKLLQQKDK